ncbi:MAG: nitrogenase iron-molybdenum cofactor biosynthesis protein NifN [Magnetospirillum sp.]|nr:nitrogenase iron-molybdenum cofactor biosynthesis protein NifN [Magnetospirillum sp.]
MAVIVPSRKGYAVNPLKSSAPLGAALAYLGIEGAVPLLHGSQGCTSFALVLSVRHFKEAIPLQTTAMDEVATILGGTDNLEEALVNLKTRMKPKFIGIASTALVETRGEDFEGDLKTILRRRSELDGTKVVFASTPDFHGALEDGWAKAVTAIIAALVEPRSPGADAFRQVNLLPGIHQTPADIEALRQLIESFDLHPVILPDLSGSLDGHVPDRYVSTSFGGTPLEAIAPMGRALHTIAIGEHMRAPALALRDKTGVPATLFPTLTGLEPCDRLVTLLSRLAGKPAPQALRRQRSQLVDSMLDSHFHFSGKRMAIAADPDLLYCLSMAVSGMGAEVVAAISSTANSPLLDRIPAERVIVGDLADFEDEARAAGAELLITHSHGRQAAARLGVPLMRAGFPIFDRLGAQHRLTVGYVGTRNLLYEIANIVQGEIHEPRPGDFSPSPRIIVEESGHVCETASAC